MLFRIHENLYFIDKTISGKCRSDQSQRSCMKSSKYLKDRYQKINELVKLNQYKEAREITEEAIIKEPNDYRLHNLLCMLLIIFKENEKAIDLALHSIKNIKKDAISYFYLGQAQWNSDQKEKGILNIIECLKIDPELQVAYNVLTGYLKIIPSMAFSNNKDIKADWWTEI